MSSRPIFFNACFALAAKQVLQRLPCSLTRSFDLKTGIVDRNASANAMVAGLRFEYGVPHHRLAKIQECKGMGLPASNQDRMIKQVAYALGPVYNELIKIAANGELLHSDDACMKILRALKVGDDPPVKKTQTTVIVSLSEGRAVVLHVTRSAQAGANVSVLPSSRSGNSISRGSSHRNADT